MYLRLVKATGSFWWVCDGHVNPRCNILIWITVLMERLYLCRITGNANFKPENTRQCLEFIKIHTVKWLFVPFDVLQLYGLKIVDIFIPEVLPVMIKQREGTIVFISSMQGKVSIPYRSACEFWSNHILKLTCVTCSFTIVRLVKFSCILVI